MNTLVKEYRMEPQRLTEMIRKAHAASKAGDDMAFTLAQRRLEEEGVPTRQRLEKVIGPASRRPTTL
jgi:hypothetical protein